MESPTSFLDVVFAIALILNTVVLGYLAWRERDSRRLIGETKEAIQKLRGKDLSPGHVHGKAGILDDRTLHRIEAAISENIGRFDREMQKELQMLERSIERLKEQIAGELPKIRALTVTAGAENVAIKASPHPQPERTFLAELIQIYNRSTDDLRSRYNAKTAQLQGRRLVQHDAGSFWVVEAPEGEHFCIPRTRKMTPTDHENVGLKSLFTYDGYDPNGPDRDIYVEKPAKLLADSAGWILGDRGVLRFIEQEV